MPSRRLAAIALVAFDALAALAACTRDRAAPPPAQQVGRVFAHTLRDTQWVARIGGDSGLASLGNIVVDDQHVYVADDETGQILAFDARNGVPAWTRAAVTEANDTIVPNAISASRGGGVLLAADPANDSWRMSADGRRVDRVPIASRPSVHALCELPDGTLVATPRSGRGSVLLFAQDSRLVGAKPIPWPDVLNASDLRLQVTFAATPTGCVVALTLGRGFATFTRDGFSTPHPYIEDTPLPTIDSTVTALPNGRRVSESLTSYEGAVESVAANSSRIAIAFGGHTPARNHVVDVYDQNGVYLESYRTTNAISAIAASDSTLYVLTRRGGLPVVVAFRWPR